MKTLTAILTIAAVLLKEFFKNKDQRQKNEHKKTCKEFCKAVVDADTDTLDIMFDELTNR